jgi:hypothetical protein
MVDIEPLFQGLKLAARLFKLRRIGQRRQCGQGVLALQRLLCAATSDNTLERCDEKKRKNRQ